MEAIVTRCAGLDVHQASVVVYLLAGEPHERPTKEVRTFGTFTGDLVALRDWLQSEGVTHVGMESSGVYWKPVYAVLEDAFELIVGNAQHIKNVPGRKGQLRKKLERLESALEGHIEEHHRFLLDLQIRRLDQADADVARLDRRIDEKLGPYRQQHERLMTIPGVDRVLAAVILAEIGVDMSVFHSVKHLAAWAGVCPGNNQSAGKRRAGRTRWGNVYLKTALIEAANAAAFKKGTYLKDKFFRLKARRGHKRAAMAIAHKILVAAYHILSTGASFQDLGEAYLDQLHKRRVTVNLVRRLQRMGYDVHIAEKVA